MAIERFKDIEILNKKYRIERMPAIVGSNILQIGFSQFLPPAIESVLNKQGMDFGSFNRINMDPATFIMVQKTCLRYCSIIQEVQSANGEAQRVPLSVISAEDVWADADLQYDLPSVMALTIECLIYNLKPFFEQGLTLLQPIISQLGLPPLTNQGESSLKSQSI
jgi:hypothetical protein